MRHCHLFVWLQEQRASIYYSCPTPTNDENLYSELVKQVAITHTFLTSWKVCCHTPEKGIIGDNESLLHSEVSLSRRVYGRTTVSFIEVSFIARVLLRRLHTTNLCINTHLALTYRPTLILTPQPLIPPTHKHTHTHLQSSKSLQDRVYDDHISTTSSTVSSSGSGTPAFFHEEPTYWTPAASTQALYKQLSTRKYRELSRKHVRYEIGQYLLGNTVRKVDMSFN